MGLFLLPGWLVAVVCIAYAEVAIYDRAARPDAYKRAKATGGDEMGWFIWAIGIVAFPITALVYVIGSTVGCSKRSA